MWCWASSPCLGRRSSCRSRRASPLSTRLRVPPLSCPHSLLVRCPRRRVVILCGRRASFLRVVVAHNKQRRTTTNVVVRRLVPDVSELGWGEVDMGGCLPWCRIIVLLVTWQLVPVSGAGGFRGGGSRFCACGRPFVFVLGRTSLFGQSSSLSLRSDDDERRIRIRRSSFGRHVAVSDVAPGRCVSKEKGREGHTVHGDDVGRRHCRMAPKRGRV